MGAWSRWLLGSAALGGVAWLVALFPWPAAPMDLVERLFLLSPLVLVPLALRAAASPSRTGAHPWPYRLAARLQLPAALLVAASFRLAPGAAAAALCAPWAVVALASLVFAATRALPRSRQRIEETCVDAGLAYLSVGALWLLFARAGEPLLGFGGAWAMLTAMHFHFAGFAAPIIGGLAGRALRDGSRARTIYRPAALALAATPLLVGLGILGSPALEVVTVHLLALALLVISSLVAFSVAPRAPRAARPFLFLSAASLVATMTSAALFALGRFDSRLATLDLDQMVFAHGVANSLGFSLCGLLGLSILAPQSALPPAGIPFSKLRGTGRIGPTFFARVGAVVERAEPPRGLLDGLEAFRRAGFDPAHVDPRIRGFYEETSGFALQVSSRWSPGFRLAGRLYRKVAAFLEQVNLPTGQVGDQEMQSAFLAIDDAADGRSRVRAWVRTYRATGKAAYVAAYATHAADGVVYMNIAFPLPLGNMASILRMDQTERGGLALTTLPRADGVPGDQGVYFANPLLPVRLPFDETITVSMGEDDTILARHDMWLFGVRFLVLDYAMTRRSA